jgi:hypothetical protein
MRLRHRVTTGAAALALVTVAGCFAPSPPSPGSTPVMGASALNAWQIAAWFEANKPGTPQLSVPLGDLVGYFLDEGGDENVRGDIAFAQSIVETGWFRYGGQVQSWQNNFAGIGAVDGGAGGAWFPDARTGVRAQIQHLRAYADPWVSRSNLAHPCVDPRFDLVSPKGKAATWNQMGNGNWATSPTYAASVLNMYNRMRTWWGLPPVAV